MIGQTVSHFKILSKLGEGGMGVVYKAEDLSLQRTVALKFLPPELTRDQEAKARFINEARAAAVLTHQNIAVVYEIGEHDGQSFIAMEYVEGKTLRCLAGAVSRAERDSQHEAPMPASEILDTAIQICEGLAVAHEQGIVHRDIKPENIIITPKGHAKITDFGLAKLKGASKLTKTGSTIGTAAYMSPEQARSEDVDRRSDIFSVGVVVYELLAGRLPFRGEHTAALLYSIVFEEPAPLARYNERVTSELQRIVSKALEKNPEDRYQHADELLSDLRRERAMPEYPQTPRSRSSAGQAPVRTGETAVPAGPAARPRGNRKTILIAAAFLALAVLVVAVLNPFNFRIGFRKAAAVDRKSIAVLPFRNMSESKEDEFFSDGVTEDIIMHLSSIGELKVISRTSVMQYKNTGKNLKDIARELNVATILEGSVRRAGNQIRIVAQLIDAANDENIWAQTYDKEMTQIFTIQSDVAQQIASALKAKLSPREKEQLGKKPTDNLDAYACYLKAREYYYRYTKQDNENAIDLFKKALGLDPRYALAYAGLGDAYAQRTYRFGFPAAWTDSSIAFSNKAISLDPNLAEGYKALGLGYEGKGWDNRAIDAYLKAIELNPNYSPALGNVGARYHVLGKFDEALMWYKRALTSNPMNLVILGSVGGLYGALGYDAKAVEWFDKALALQPDFNQPRWFLGSMHLERSECRQALDQARRVLSLEPDDVGCLTLAGDAELLLGNYAEAEQYFEKGAAIDSIFGPNSQLGYVYWKTGRKDKARDWFARSLGNFRRQLEQGREDAGIHYEMARIHAILGNKPESYKWLQKAIDAGWRNYRYGSIDPLLENLHSDEQFKQVMMDLKAKVEEMRKRVEEMEKKDSGDEKTG